MFNIFEVLGEVGGVLNIVKTLLAFALSSYSKSSFFMHFMTKMKVFSEEPSRLQKICKSKEIKDKEAEFA